MAASVQPPPREQGPAASIPTFRSDGRLYNTGLSIRERLECCTDRSGDCWIWTGKIRPDGYGEFTFGGVTNRRYRRAHRVSYEEYVGPIPEGLEIDHICRNPACVNPAHLEPVTGRENKARSANPAAHALRTNHCIHGHEFTPENTRTRRNGSRACIQCQRQRARDYRARMKAAQKEASS